MNHLFHNTSGSGFGCGIGQRHVFPISLRPCFAWTPTFPQTKNQAESIMNKLMEMLDDFVGHLEYYLERSVAFWMVIFFIYILTIIITAELGG